MVLDNYTSSLIRNFIEDSEILNRQIASIEIIDSHRQKVGLEVIYFLQPTLYNVDCITADFTRLPRRYEFANIFFLPLASPQINGIIQKLKSGSAQRFLKRLEETHLDFRPTESQMFTLGDPHSLEKLFNPQCHDLVVPMVSQIAGQLVSVCVTLGEYPIVRFYKPNIPTFEGHILSFMIAQEFQKQLDDYARSHADFLGTTESNKRPRSVFLITDRSMDLFAPVLHEFTFQALVYDLLEFNNWKECSYKIQDGNGKTEVRKGQLSEKDPEWVSLRHSHVQDAITNLIEKRKKLISENPNFENKSQIANINDIKGMMLGLSSYMEQRDRLTFYINLLSNAMDTVKLNEVLKSSLIEQTLSTGLNDEGSKPKAIIDELIECLANKIPNMDKTRLIMIYALFRKGLIEQDYLRLQNHCGLSNRDIELIRNYKKLGAPIIKSSPNIQLSKTDFPQHFHSSLLPGECLVSSRYVTGLYNVLGMLLSGKLSPETFPYIKGQPTDEFEDEADVGLNSLRSRRQRPNWALNTSTTQAARQRVFVFVAGGVTASEIRSCYELSDKYSREIIIGSGDYTEPKQFLSSLLNLSKDRRELCLEEDKDVPTKAPAFLYESEIIQPSKPQHVEPPKPAFNTQVNCAQLEASNSLKHDKKKGKLSKFLKSYK